MSRRRLPHIALRRPIYVGCEGASEVGYAGLLQDLVRDMNLPVHLQIEELGPGTGDPLSRIEMAVLRLGQLQRRRSAPVERFALLDFDQAERDPDRAEKACNLAARNKIAIVWQRPCFEALLLRHLEGQSLKRPPNASLSFKAIAKEWPEYKKGMPRANLTRRIDQTAIARAAAVEPDLKAMLRCIGLL